MSNDFHTPVPNVDENNMVVGDDPEVDPGNASGNRLQRTRKGIFTRGPPSRLRFSNKFTVASQLQQLENARFARLREHFNELLGIDPRPAASLISPRDKISELYSGIPPFFPGFTSLSRDELPVPAAPVDPDVNSGAFPPPSPALSYHHQSHSTSGRSVKKVRKGKYLEKEEKDTRVYEGAMNFTQDGRQGAYSGGHDDNPFTWPSIPAVPVPYHPQSHSESERPVKKARTKYHSDVEKEKGFYDNPHYHEHMMMDKSGEAEGANAGGRSRDPNTVGKVFYLDQSSPFPRTPSASPPPISNW